MKGQALHLGKRIDVKGLQAKLPLESLYRDFLFYRLSKGKSVLVFRYGVVVFWGMKEGEINEFLLKIDPFTQDPLERPFKETMELLEKSSPRFVVNNRVHVEEINEQTIQVASQILARSIVLEYFELQVEATLKAFGDIIHSFAEEGRTRTRARTLLKYVGNAMRIQHLAVTQMAMLDKPDLTWEDGRLDRLYEALSEEYEISPRYRVLTQKLATLFHDSEFIVNYLESRRSVFIEIIIVVLILIEILLFVYELGFLNA